MDWSVLFSTLGLVFVAELGDKTQLAVVTQTCKFRKPWAVFLGASLALAAVTALGVIGGQVLGQFIPEAALRYAAALAFIVMGLLIGREAYKASREGDSQLECSLEEGTEDERAKWDWKAFSATFGLLFIAELGDKTQLAVFSLAGRHGTPVPVFVGGALALTLVTAMGVIGGEGLSRLIPERVLQAISAVAFVIMGLLMALGVL